MGEFKIGDLVQLKSGGPEMTVHGNGLNGSVRVIWFGDYKVKPEWHDFPADTLKRVKTP